MSSLMDDLFGNQKQNLKKIDLKKMSSLMDDLFGNQKQDLKNDYKEINNRTRMSRHVSKEKQLPKNNVIQKEDDTLHVPCLTNKKPNTFNNDNIANKPKIKMQKEINEGKINMIIKDGKEEIKNTTSSMSNGKFFISEPTKYKEVEKSADLLLQGNPFIVKLNKLAESNQLKEMVYFLRGIIYAANGNIKEINEKTFLCTPKTIEVEDLFGNNDAQEKDNSSSSTITKTIDNKSQNH